MSAICHSRHAGEWPTQSLHYVGDVEVVILLHHGNRRISQHFLQEEFEDCSGQAVCDPS